ncbi:hypothetical protein ACTXT7_011376 [Hymenolepis weldensis]
MSASWEAEKSSSCSIRRLCHIQIGQIILDRPIDLGEHPSNGVYVALRMLGNTRRILRSPEISLVIPKTIQNAPNSHSPGGGGYILIDLNCTIQYSHVLKMDSNILQILLQKRKKYKNTTMNLGYKTLAYCNINLSQRNSHMTISEVEVLCRGVYFHDLLYPSDEFPYVFKSNLIGRI